jgi:hypothetical protein
LRAGCGFIAALHVDWETGQVCESVSGENTSTGRFIRMRSATLAVARSSIYRMIP